MGDFLGRVEPAISNRNVRDLLCQAETGFLARYARVISVAGEYSKHFTVA